MQGSCGIWPAHYLYASELATGLMNVMDISNRETVATGHHPSFGLPETGYHQFTLLSGMLLPAR
jgi:hypothetical protein